MIMEKKKENKCLIQRKSTKRETEKFREIKNLDVIEQESYGSIQGKAVGYMI